MALFVAAQLVRGVFGDVPGADAVLLAGVVRGPRGREHAGAKGMTTCRES